MATSGTFAFNFDLGEAIEEAFERAGLELRSAYDYKTARRSIEPLMLAGSPDGIFRHLDNQAAAFVRMVSK